MLWMYETFLAACVCPADSHTINPAATTAEVQKVQWENATMFQLQGQKHRWVGPF